MYILGILYITAAFVAIGACIPQIVQLVKLRRSDEFELSTWAVWLLTQLVSVAYVASLGNVLMIIANSAWVSFYAVMVYLIIHYRLRPVPVEQVSETKA